MQIIWCVCRFGSSTNDGQTESYSSWYDKFAQISPVLEYCYQKGRSCYIDFVNPEKLFMDMWQYSV